MVNILLLFVLSMNNNLYEYNIFQTHSFLQYFRDVTLFPFNIVTVKKPGVNIIFLFFLLQLTSSFCLQFFPQTDIPSKLVDPSPESSIGLYFYLVFYFRGINYTYFGYPLPVFQAYDFSPTLQQYVESQFLSVL